MKDHFQKFLDIYDSKVGDPVDSSLESYQLIVNKIPGYE